MIFRNVYGRGFFIEFLPYYFRDMDIAILSDRNNLLFSSLIGSDFKDFTVVYFHSTFPFS